MVRWSSGEWAVVDACAASVGVATGALVRECAVRVAADVAREVREGRLVLRGRGGSEKASVVGDGGSESPGAMSTLPASSRDPAVGRAAAFRGRLG